MSTMPTTYRSNPITGAKSMQNSNLSEIVRKIRALRALTRSTGFSTNRTVGQMLDRLSEDDLIKLGEAFLLLDGVDNNK
jgi:hypothetical protein